MFKNLLGSMGNAKILRNHVKAHSGILIAPLKRLQVLNLWQKGIDDAARMVNFDVSLFPILIAAESID